MEIGGEGLERGHGDRARRRRRRDERPVPVDLHVGADAHAGVGAQELPREVRDDRLVLARGKAEVGNYGAPPTGCVLHLHLERDDLDRS